MNRETHIKRVIEEICAEDSGIRKFEIFKDNRELLSKCRILLFDQNESSYLKKWGNQEFGKFSLQGLGDYSKTFVLDKNILDSPIKPIRISRCANFDLNIVSYIRKIFYGEGIFNEVDFKELLIYLKEEKFQTTIQAYLFERGYNNIDYLDEKATAEIIKACIMYENSSIDNLKREIIKKVPLNSDDEKMAHERFSLLLETYRIDSYKKPPNFLSIYSLLLKTFIIKYSKNSEERKINQLILFALDELNCYMERELVMCALYLKKDDNVMPFFRKMQLTTKDILKELQNMTWDILHIRNMEAEMAIRNQDVGDVYLHYFVSRDERLMNALKANQAKSFVMIDGKGFIISKKNISDICQDKAILDKFRNEADKQSHQLQRVDYEAILKKLKHQLKEIRKN